jgi:outer membrane protein OmpA-like peptidoglycan-associated protein
MKNHFILCYFCIVTFVFCNLHFAYSQNLIPNPGFEEHHSDSVSLWEHALSPFYHFAPLTIIPHSGSNCLGLCIWKYDPTEYLQVKLTEKLEKGSEYELKMFVSFDSHIIDCEHDIVTELGCYFSDTSLYLKNRTQLYLEPQIIIPLDKNTSWVEKKEYFIAKGNENFLVIGKYFDYKDNPNDTASIRLKILANKKIDSIEAEKESKINTEIARIKNKYETNSADFDKIKNKRKRQQKMNEFRFNVSKMRSEIQASMNFIEYSYSLKIPKQTEKNYCRIRINIDDISLTKNTLKNVIEFDDTLAEGKIFRLNNIFFETDKSELLAKSFEELDKLFLMLKNSESMKIEISGHTDSTGMENHNLLLSQARAKAVVDYLVQKGIDKTRISYKGYGSSNPMTTNDTEEGRAENRRVEFKILKN